MKRSKIIIIGALTIVLLVCGTVFTINATDTANDMTEATMSAEAALELDKRTKIFDEKRARNNENDLKALEILRSYNKTNATDLIQDKQEDCSLMFEICDMIKNNAFNSEEEQVMKNYLERRLLLLDDYDEETEAENDSVLISEIKGVLNYESYNQ